MTTPWNSIADSFVQTRKDLDLIAPPIAKPQRAPQSPSSPTKPKPRRRFEDLTPDETSAIEASMARGENPEIILAQMGLREPLSRLEQMEPRSTGQKAKQLSRAITVPALEADKLIHQGLKAAVRFGPEFPQVRPGYGGFQTPELSEKVRTEIAIGALGAIIPATPIEQAVFRGAGAALGAAGRGGRRLGGQAAERLRTPIAEAAGKADEIIARDVVGGTTYEYRVAPTKVGSSSMYQLSLIHI